MFGSLDLSYKNLKSLLKLVDYTKIFIFMCVRECYYNMLHEVIKEIGLKVPFDDVTVQKIMKKEDALKIDVV